MDHTPGNPARTQKRGLPQKPGFSESFAPPTAYGAPFWFAYAANMAVMVAMSLLFRYADFITYLGGTELHLGIVWGVGMVGSFVMRFAQGVGIDRYGTRRIWLLSAVLFVMSCLGHLLVTQPVGPLILLMRVAFSTGVAGMFGAAMVHVARQAPTIRMAEMIGMLGTSGFLGMVLGPILGDLLFSTGPLVEDQATRAFGSATGALADHLQRAPERRQIVVMFAGAASLGAVSFAFAWLATRGQAAPARRRHVPVLGLLRRYFPGAVLAVAVAMGIGVGMPRTFLAKFADTLGIEKISIFFVVYAPAAFSTRVLARRWPERLGTRPVALLGLTCLAVSMPLYLVVDAAWQWAFPALFAGFAHALLFPAVVAGGSSAFPDRYRGVGTTLMMSMLDLGELLGTPVLGAIVHYASYPAMFLSLAGYLVLMGLVYGFARGLAGRKERCAET